MLTREMSLVTITIPTSSYQTIAVPNGEAPAQGQPVLAPTSQVQPQVADPNATKDKAQKDKTNRKIVHHDHVSKLVRDY